MERVWRVNVMGIFHCLQHELRQMEAQRRGAIVNVSSLAGLTGVEGTPAYTAAKHAVVGLTRAAALQYGPLGIRVNVICPSGIKTEMYRIQGVDNDA
jgi:NAD(P)-dependent dehydrogenase (short-subunit alcohol dehydrogenase family)